MATAGTPAVRYSLPDMDGERGRLLCGTGIGKRVHIIMIKDWKGLKFDIPIRESE